MSDDVHVLRVFLGPGGTGGNPLGVVLDPTAVRPGRRQGVAAALAYSETVFLDDESGALRIFTPASELPFAGHPLVGCGWLLRHLGLDVATLRPPAGEVPAWADGDLSWIRGRLEWAPAMTVRRLGSPAEVDALDGPGDEGFLYAWAWLDDDAGTVRSRMFAPEHGIVEDEATGAAAVRLTGDLGRPLRIRQGVGSELITRPGPDGTVDRGEVERCAPLTEWGAARTPPGTRRIDVVGGSLWGWEGFLTIFGSSMLRTDGALTVVDLTGQAVSRELVDIARAGGVTSDVQVLPDGLATSDLLTGLSAQGLVDALVESLYGDAESTERANRAMDERILSAVCGALGADLSIARLSAALRLLMGEPNPSDLLSAEEQQIVADELFSEQYRQQAHSHLRRMESFLHPLERLGAAAAPRPVANLTCLLSVSDGRNARNELLNDLIVQWLVRRMSTSAELPRTLVVAGADELQRRQLEKLSDVCEQRHVRLVLMFRHLRDASLQVLGGGAVAFMRLGNHEEATRAADFVGRHHTFVLSQLTRTLGGNETHTNTEGDTVSDGISGDWGLLFRRAQQWNHGRSWSQTNSYAAGTNWSDAMSQQRVYEYAVEPRTLQDLPDYAMLLVESRAGGPVLRAVECNPSIVTLPRVSMDELPHLPLPAHPEVPGRLPVQQIATSGFAQPTNRGVPVSPQGYPGMRPPPGAPQVGRMPGAGQWRGPGPGPRT